MFEQADFEDIKRYLDKRAIYLRAMGNELTKHSDLFGVSLSTFKGDLRKPILLIHPEKGTILQLPSSYNHL
jgi:hypothetical protein